MNGHVTLRGTHVLSKGHDIDVHIAQFPQGFPKLLLRFAQTEHDGGFGDEAWFGFFGMLEHAQALSEFCPPVANGRGEFFDGFDIVRVDVKTAGGDFGDHGQIAGVVTCQGLDKHARRFALNLDYRFGEMVRAAIR